MRLQHEQLIRLTGKVCLVTGGSRGIGQAIAKGLAAHGSVVVIWDVNAERNAEAEALDLSIDTFRDVTAVMGFPEVAAQIQ